MATYGIKSPDTEQFEVTREISLAGSPNITAFKGDKLNGTFNQARNCVSVRWNGTNGISETCIPLSNDYFNVPVTEFVIPQYIMPYAYYGYGNPMPSLPRRHRGGGHGRSGGGHHHDAGAIAATDQAGHFFAIAGGFAGIAAGIYMAYHAKGIANYIIMPVMIGALGAFLGAGADVVLPSRK